MFFCTNIKKECVRVCVSGGGGGGVHPFKKRVMGAARKVKPSLEGGGGVQKFWTPDFPMLYPPPPHLPVFNDRSLGLSTNILLHIIPPPSDQQVYLRHRLRHANSGFLLTKKAYTSRNPAVFILHMGNYFV